MRYLIVLLLAPLLYACGEREDQYLLGEWRAVSVTENGDSLRLDPAEVTFRFTPNNRYRYTSTLRYAEAGTWRYEQGHLFATDTTGAATEPRVVSVDLLRPDSLVLGMNGGLSVVLLRD